jgi:hypothetical protein
MGGGRDVFEIATKTMKESRKKSNSTKDRNRGERICDISDQKKA